MAGLRIASRTIGLVMVFVPGPREEEAKPPRGSDIIGGARSRPKVDLEGSLDRLPIIQIPVSPHRWTVASPFRARGAIELTRPLHFCPAASSSLHTDWLRKPKLRDALDKSSPSAVGMSWYDAAFLGSLRGPDLTGPTCLLHSAR